MILNFKKNKYDYFVFEIGESGKLIEKKNTYKFVEEKTKYSFDNYSEMFICKDEKKILKIINTMKSK